VLSNRDREGDIGMAFSATTVFSMSPPLLLSEGTDEHVLLSNEAVNITGANTGVADELDDASSPVG